MKIAIVGYSGSGKSTLARHISKAMGIPVLHLDKVNWAPGWNVRNKNDQMRIVSDFLADNSSWVIDGNYKSLSYDDRMSSADKIIFMCFNRFSCLLRAIKRYKMYKGRTREDICCGCDEKLDLVFIKWILLDGRKRNVRNKYMQIMKTYPQKVMVIKNQKQLDKLYMSLEQGGEYGKSL